jgi:hypothetical protein
MLPSRLMLYLDVVWTDAASPFHCTKVLKTTITIHISKMTIFWLVYYMQRKPVLPDRIYFQTMLVACELFSIIWVLADMYGKSMEIVWLYMIMLDVHAKLIIFNISVHFGPFGEDSANFVLAHSGNNGISAANVIC